MSDNLVAPHGGRMIDLLVEAERALEGLQLPAREREGLTVFFTGLSGARKSTIANVLLVKFLEMGGRPVSDGSVIRVRQ